MIIDKVQPYWTEEENLKAADIRDQQGVLLSKARHARDEENDPETARILMEQWADLAEEVNTLQKAVGARYTKARTHKELVEDAKEILSATTKEDFLEIVAERKEQIFSLQANGASEESLKPLIVYAEENYTNCYTFLLQVILAQLDPLAGDEENANKIFAALEKRTSLWYVKPQPTHLPIPYSKPTDALAFMSQKKATIDRISGDATIDRFNVQLRIAKFKTLKASLGVSTDKLLSTSLAVFARNNDLSKSAKTATNRRVVIPLKDYAKLLGYDVEERETNTPEEAEAERKRAKHALDNARKKTQKDLDILYNLSFEWEERIRGKVESFRSVRLLSSKEYRAGNIAITFTPEIADHFVTRGLMTQYNTGMLKLDERKPNAYYIMRKLEEHYNMDANQSNNRNDRIGIDTILAVTDLPSFEEVEKTDRGHWERRIKDPLEESLDYLIHEGLLSDWEYTHAKGIPLTEEESYNISSYEDYKNLYLHFTPTDTIDHTERQERRKSERAKKAERKKKKN